MPSESSSPPGSLFFGEDFELDRKSYELKRSGQALKLERIPLEILSFLIEQQGQLVTREQIAERVWGKDKFLDIDNSINGAIRKIRQTLRDNPEAPRFIETLTGRGYRFIAPVIKSAKAPAESTARPPRRAGIAVGIALLLLAISGAMVALRPHSHKTSGPSGRVMLAVLPFQNLTGDPGQEYLSDGLTEEIITQLGSRDPSRLGVIARTSVMHFKNSATPLRQIAAELDVQFVLQASVRRDSSAVRVSAQLVQTKDQTQIWAGQFDRPPGAVLAMEGEIAQKIAGAIESKLGGQVPAAPAPTRASSSSAAYDLYLKGQYFLNKRSAPDLETAIGYFHRSAEKDSTAARTFAALADAYTLLPGYSMKVPEPLLAAARAAAVKALALDSALPEAHTALALIVENHDWDWATAGREFRRAITLNPNYATAHHWYAEYLTWQGQFDEALKESERARQLDPLSLIIAADNGAILYYSRQYDRAIAKWESVIGIDPELSRADLIIAAYAARGRFKDALARVERRRLSFSESIYSLLKAYVYGRSGQTELARLAIRKALETSRNAPLQAGFLAWAASGMQDTEQTLAWLEKAYADRSNEMTNLKVSPTYDFLRGDPRFQTLLTRIGLAQ